MLLYWIYVVCNWEHMYMHIFIYLFMYTCVCAWYMPLLMNNAQSSKFQLIRKLAEIKQIHPLNIKSKEYQIRFWNLNMYQNHLESLLQEFPGSQHQSFWFSSTWVGPENLYLQQVPTHMCQCCWFRDYTLRATVLDKFLNFWEIKKISAPPQNPHA